MAQVWRMLIGLRPLLIVVLLGRFVSGQAGRDWGQPGQVYRDPVTQLEIRELTGAATTSDNLYYHFSNFTADNQFVLFTSTLEGETQLFRAVPQTGQVVQLTTGSALGARSACPDPHVPQRVFVLRGAEVLALDVHDFSLRKIGEIPPPRVGGYSQPTVSGDGQWLALGKQRDAENWEIGRLHVATGEYQTVVTQGFRLGHIQHSPTDPWIFYVWETGGYAPQRSWLVNTDGTGNRPFYARTNRADWFTPLKEWVTHEAWVSQTGEMTMVNDRQGIMLVAKDGSARMICQGNYWHAAARADGKYVVLDDDAGRLWLLAVATGELRLLATNLRAQTRVHPHPSFDRWGDYVFFHTGRLHETVALLDLRQLPKEFYAPLEGH